MAQLKLSPAKRRAAASLNAVELPHPQMSPTKRMPPPSPIRVSSSPSRRPPSYGRSPSRTHSPSRENRAFRRPWLDLAALPKPETIWRVYKYFFNGAMALLFCNILYLSVNCIRDDIRAKVEAFAGIKLSEIEECSHNYFENKCMPANRVPALDELCHQWEQCMNQNPESVVHGTLFAELLGEILHSFVSQLSWSAIALLIVMVPGTMVFVNYWGA